MKISVLCIGKRSRDWVTTATEQYLKRLKGQLDVGLVEVSPGAKGGNSASNKHKEALKLRRSTPSKAYRVALDERGELWTTKDLASRLNSWRSDHANVVCYIGGADGLDREFRESAEVCWSLSPLTLPHQMARVILVEQLYRAWSLLQQHPYHRA